MFYLNVEQEQYILCVPDDYMICTIYIQSNYISIYFFETLVSFKTLEVVDKWFYSSRVSINRNFNKFSYIQYLQKLYIIICTLTSRTKIKALFLIVEGLQSLNLNPHQPRNWIRIHMKVHFECISPRVKVLSNQITKIFKRSVTFCLLLPIKYCDKLQFTDICNTIARGRQGKKKTRKQGFPICST